MTVHEFPKNVVDAMVRGILPNFLTQSCVLLEFGDPEPLGFQTSEFYRIALNEQSLGAGADKFHEPHIWLPQLGTIKTCGRCQTVMAQVHEHVWKCRRCQAMSVEGSVRGVVKVLTFDQFVIGQETAEYVENGLPKFVTHDVVDRCVLVLDRQYPDPVRKGVWRLAGMICEEKGWKLL